MLKRPRAARRAPWPRPAPHAEAAAARLADDDWARQADSSRLFEAILRLRTVEECTAFFRDLCTIHELVTLSHRWQVARLLEEGLPYQEIAHRTGASTATITRINTWRRFGTGGYRLALDRLRSRAR